MFSKGKMLGLPPPSTNNRIGSANAVDGASLLHGLLRIDGNAKTD
jgi:hypothetical protein